MKSQQTDFKTIMIAIHNTGLTDMAISIKLGIIRSKVTKIRLGYSKAVYYDDGVAIMKLAGELLSGRV